MLIFLTKSDELLVGLPLIKISRNKKKKYAKEEKWRPTGGRKQNSKNTHTHIKYYFLSTKY